LTDKLFMLIVDFSTVMLSFQGLHLWTGLGLGFRVTYLRFMDRVYNRIQYSFSFPRIPYPQNICDPFYLD